MTKKLAMQYLEDIAEIEWAFDSDTIPTKDLLYIDYHIATTKSRYYFFVSKYPIEEYYIGVSVRVSDHESWNEEREVTEKWYGDKHVSLETDWHKVPYKAFDFITTDSTRISFKNIHKLKGVK